MGSAQSYVSSELVGTVLTGLVIVGAVGISFTRLGSSSHDDSTTSTSPAIKKGKKKQNKGPAGGAASGPTASEPPPPQAVYLSNTIPGQFDSSAAENVIPKAKKPKKKKNQNTEDAAKKNSSIPSQHHSESSIQSVPMASRDTKRSPQPQTPKVTPGPEILSPRALLATISLDTDSSWTQVGSKRNRKSSTLRPSGESQSEASFSTSQKDESSPRNTAEDDNHDSFLLQQSMLPPSSWSLQNQKTLAEKLMPNPRKTDVEDLPGSPGLSQVVRVTPLPNEKPVAGFSWADYEDVRVATDGGENDADGEDDGWGVVTSKRPRKLNIPSSSSQSLKAPETLTKKQRQNAQKREQQKAAKSEAEAQRLATLAGHKRDLEKVRMDGRASSSKTGGGMRATVDERGKLIWE